MGTICQLTVSLSIRNFGGTGEFEQEITKETKGVVCHDRPEAGVYSVQFSVFSRKTEGLSRSHGERGGISPEPEAEWQEIA